MLGKLQRWCGLRVHRRYNDSNGHRLRGRQVQLGKLQRMFTMCCRVIRVSCRSYCSNVQRILRCRVLLCRWVHDCHRVNVSRRVVHQRRSQCMLQLRRWIRVCSSRVHKRFDAHMSRRNVQLGGGPQLHCLPRWRVRACERNVDGDVLRKLHGRLRVRRGVDEWHGNDVCRGLVQQGWGGLLYQLLN